MGWAPTQTVLRADMRLHRGDPMRLKALRGTSIGLGRASWRERTCGGGAWKEEEALLGRRSRQGEEPRGELPAGGSPAGCEVVVLDVCGQKGAELGGGRQSGAQEGWLA